MTLLLGRRIAQLVVGQFLYGVAIGMMIQARIGVSPWEVLSQGVSRHTGVSFGWVTNITGILVLLLWIPLRQRPGVGTVLNVFLIGSSAQSALGIIPAQTSPVGAALLFSGGLLLLTFSTGMYIGARFGPGPRDGLMTGLHARTGWPIWMIRAGIELTVLALGWILGGNVGIGTLAFAVLVGPLVNLALPLLRIPPAAPRPLPVAA